MTKPADTPPATPPAAPPAEPVDEKKLGEMIAAQVTALFEAKAKEQPAPPATPPATPPAGPAPASGAPAGDLGALINRAVETALKERDREDQVSVLAEEIEKLKKHAGGPRKAGWGAYLLGPGLARR